MHRSFVAMGGGFLLVFGDGSDLRGEYPPSTLSAGIGTDAHDSGDTASSSAGPSTSGFSGSSAASGMVAQ